MFIVPPQRRSWLRELVLGAVVLVLAGCEANAAVTVDVAEDGSGTVTAVVDIDGEALARLGGMDAVDVSGLDDAGWTVAEPKVTDAGTLRMRASKDYPRPDALQGVLEEITGPDGPLREVNVGVVDTFGGTRYELAGRLVTDGELTQFSDEGVSEALDGLPLGRSAEQLANELAAEPGALTLEFTVNLPGELTGSNADARADPEGDGTDAKRSQVVWRRDLTGEASDTALAATSQQRTSRAQLLVVAGGVVVLVAGLLLAYGLRGSRRLDNETRRY
ncbi:MAG: hypothetical protein R2754_09000 [Microthrixaceae bacterium]